MFLSPSVLPLFFIISFSHNLKDLLIGEWDVFKSGTISIATDYTIEFHPSEYGLKAPNTLNCTLWKDESVRSSNSNSFKSQSDIPLIASIKLDFTSNFSGSIQNIIINPLYKELRSNNDFPIDFNFQSHFKQKVQFTISNYQFTINLSDFLKNKIIAAEAVSTVSQEHTTFTIRPTPKYENVKTAYKAPVHKKTAEDFIFNDIEDDENDEYEHIDYPFFHFFTNLLKQYGLVNFLENGYLFITLILTMIMVFMVAKLILYLICPSKPRKGHKKGTKKDGERKKHKKKVNVELEEKGKEENENVAKEENEKTVTEEGANKQKENQ